MQLPECPKPVLAPSFSLAAPWLAPLAGYSDLPFRLLCRELGAAVCVTEMISAKGLLYGNSGTADLLSSIPADQPLIVQLFGGEPEAMAAALMQLRGVGYYWFDCNMGCPMRKVVRQGAGAALMADLPMALQVAQAMLKAAREAGMPPARVGFKLRLPPDGIAPLLNFAKRLEDAGASWLTLHPRTAAQCFGGHANWEAIGTLARAVSIPVIASGDLLTARAALDCLEGTGAATVMYARGALYNPAVFAEHCALAKGEPVKHMDAALLGHIIGRHMALCQRYGNPRNAFKKMRSIIPRYVKSLPGVGKLRQHICVCEDWQELANCIKVFLVEVSKHEGYCG